MPLGTLPLGLVDAPRKSEEGAIRMGRRDHLAEMQRRQQAQEASHRQYEEIWARLDQMGSLPGMPKPVGGDLVESSARPSVAPSEGDPNRDMAPMGASPKLSQRDIQGDPIPAGFNQSGVGGPEPDQPPQDELAAIEAELARRELAQVEAELARRGQAEPQADPLMPKGGWTPEQQAKQQARDPNDPFNAANNAPSEDQDKPWNEQLADMLDGGVEGIMDLFKGQRDPENDPVGAAAEAFVKPVINLPSSALRDPGGTALAISPPHMAARAYGAANSALIDVTQGDFEGAKQNAGTALMEGGNAVLSVAGAGLLKPKGPRSALDAASAATKQPPVREPSVREARKTLAATAVPGRPIRPQATKAIEKILINSGVPSDRIASGLTKVVERLQGTVDGGAKRPRPLTVGAALKQEFGNEFPEVRQNIDTVRLERRLTRKRGDASPTIVREAVQDMRGSQVEYLTGAAEKNFGSEARTGTRSQISKKLRELGRTGYDPILSQVADGDTAHALTSVMRGPGMEDLMTPLRKIAAGEGKDIDTLIKDEPIRAAHWMQSRAREIASGAKARGDKVEAKAYGSMRERLLTVLDELKTPEGMTYKQLRDKYGDILDAETALEAGDQFGALVRNPDGANQFLDAFKKATPEQQDAQLASVRDWILSKLRGGGEEGAARMAELQNIAVLDTLDRLGAKGKAMADDIRAIRDEEADLARFFPKSESASISNLEAQRSGPDIYSKTGGKTGAGASALADGAMMAADVSKLPVLSIFSKGRDAMKELGRPRRETREDMTKVLMSRPGKGAKSSALVEPEAAPSKPTPAVAPDATYAELAAQADEAWKNGQWELANDLQRQANALKAGPPPKTEAPSKGGADAALKAQGFDTDKVYYHGTYQKDFDTFDMSKVGTREVPWYGEGAYLSPDRDLAKRYGDKVLPFYVRGKLLTIDKNNPWPEWLQKGADIKKELADRGYVGLQINNTVKGFRYDRRGNVLLDEQGKPIDVESSMPETVVFDPANIIRADKPKK